MNVRFWGVRGTIAVPGPTTLRYGGNTSCVAVQIDGLTLILDAGTGIRELGIALLASTDPIAILPTHAHIDHVIGFPFFKPLYQADRRIHIVNCRAAGREWSPLELLDGFQMPLSPEKIEADVHTHAASDLKFLAAFDLDVRTIQLNHPGGSTGFRIAQRGRTVIYLMDNELDASDAVTEFDDFVRFCRDADVLIHDAQYSRHDRPMRWGWGHSTAERVGELAAAANVGRLVLFHHDPARTDDLLETLEDEVRDSLAPHGIACQAGREGASLEL